MGVGISMLSRPVLANQVYFVTTKTFKNRRIFDVDATCQLLMETITASKAKYGFKLYGYAILPDHVHILIEPSGNFTVSQVMQKIKGTFARELKLQIKKRVAASLARGDSKTVAYAGDDIDLIEYGKPIWQKSFYDHAIRNHQDFIEKLTYIHKNPLKHGLTEDPLYRWSSWAHYHAPSKNPLINDPPL